MPKTTKASNTLNQAAERAKPGWKAVTPVPSFSSDASVAAVDESAPELEELRRKYLGEKAPDVKAKKAVALGRSVGAHKKPTDDLKMVVMEPITATDTRVGRKVIVLDKKGRKIGDQG